MLVYKRMLFDDVSEKAKESYIKEGKKFFSLPIIQDWLKKNNFFKIFEFWAKACSSQNEERNLFDPSYNAEVLAYLLSEICKVDFNKYLTQEQLKTIKDMRDGVWKSIIDTEDTEE